MSKYRAIRSEPGLIGAGCSKKGRKQSIQISFSNLLMGCLLLCSLLPSVASAKDISEYRLKVAFLYNFIAYTHWPDQQDINVCIHGEDPFGENIQYLRNKRVNNSNLLIQYSEHIKDLSGCQVIFIARSAMYSLEDILAQVKNKPVLTVSDSPNTSQRGVIINMAVKEGKIVFNANLKVARSSNLKLSSQLFRLAIKVYQ